MNMMVEEITHQDRLWHQLVRVEEKLADLKQIRALLDKQIKELEAEKDETEKQWNDIVRGEWDIKRPDTSEH